MLVGEQKSGEAGGIDPDPGEAPLDLPEKPASMRMAVAPASR
jgi:hypothetical protein